MQASLYVTTDKERQLIVSEREQERIIDFYVHHALRWNAYASHKR